MRLVTAAAVLALLAPAASQAASCSMIFYFSDKSHSRPVGSWSNCPGQKGLTGSRSRYFEKETEEIRASPIHGNGLPCEFLERGCRIFEPRPNAAQ